MSSNTLTNAEPIRTWTYDMPYQYAWVEAYTQSKDLEPIKALEQIHNELDEICKIRMWHSPSGRYSVDCLPDVLISTLHTSCPYCEGGAHQTLKSSGWKYVHSWTDDYVKKAAQYARADNHIFNDEETSVQRITSQHFNPVHEALTEQTQNSAELTSPLSKNNLGETDQALPNNYGIAYSAVCEIDPKQPTLSLGNLPFLDVSFGIEGIFSGVYQCKCCHHYFAVVFRSPTFMNDTREDHILVNTVLDQLLASTNSLKQMNMTATIRVEPECITINAPIMGLQHVLCFDTKCGDTILNEVRAPLYSLNPCHFEHPIFKPYLFGMPDFINRVLDEIHSLCSRDHETKVGANLVCNNVKINGSVLLVANRFLGYPESFYERVVIKDAVYNICPLLSGLPRRYEDIGRAYEMTGLPDKKSLKRALFKNPILLFEVLHSPGIPFENIDILARFLNSNRAAALLKRINFSASSCFGWRLLAQAKGESNLLNYIESINLFKVQELSDILRDGLWLQKPEFKNAIKHTPLNKMKEQLEYFRWIHNHPDLDMNKPYEYRGEQKQMEARIDNFSFVLPRTPKDLIDAGNKLHNCLASYADESLQTGKKTIILIYEHAKIIGAVEVRVDFGLRYIDQAHTACNKKMGSNESLMTAFLAWTRNKKLNFDKV